MKLVVLGMGYSSSAFVAEGASLFSAITATVRSENKAGLLRQRGFNALVLDVGSINPAINQAIMQADALLMSIPAQDGGDPVLPGLGHAIAASPNLRWIGYLSTVGVYGDHQGGWVNEASELRATSQRGLNRIAAERGWLDLGAATGKPVQVFRLAGIYGPGRNQLEAVRSGTARRIIKQGQMFSRIHVKDIAGACLASPKAPFSGAVYNVADNEPAPPQDVITFAATLLCLPAPPEELFESAIMSAMAHSFYMDSRRVANTRLRKELGYQMHYPTYREGLAALYREGEGH